MRLNGVVVILVACLGLGSELALAKTLVGEHSYTLQVATATKELSKEQLYEQIDKMMLRLNPNGLHYEELREHTKMILPERVVNILMRAKDKAELIFGDLSVSQILTLNSITREQCTDAEFTRRRNICLKLSDYMAFEAFCVRAKKYSKIWCKEQADVYRKDIVPGDEKVKIVKFSPEDKLFQRLAQVYDKHNPTSNHSYDGLLGWQKDAIMTDVAKVLKETKKSTQVFAGLNVGEILELSSIEKYQCSKEEFDRRRSICTRLWKRLSLDAYCKRAIEVTTKECRRLMVATKAKIKWWKHPVNFFAGRIKWK